MLLSIVPHQEPRFLIPCVPLLLSCLRIPKSRWFLAAWVIFNAALGFLMGVYHQGGIVPAQLAIPSIISANAVTPNGAPLGSAPVSAVVLWWKTYSPPLWLLGDSANHSLDIESRDLMGMSGPEMDKELRKLIPSCPSRNKNGAEDLDTELARHPDAVFIVAPKSAKYLDSYTKLESDRPDLELHELWSYSKHINMDDLDFGTDGIISTLRRVIGRRGLAVWAVRRHCTRETDEI
ncbi:hypothetical protein EYZ11_005812 [Aspergillus tanneri]|nr:hypothetical protein EYZ11_005812 [Aspergillus tanneri]